MNYNFNGKVIKIPDSEIEKLKSGLELSQQEAIELWLCDNGYDEDEEQEKLDENAKKVKILHDVNPKTSKSRKPAVKKISDEKKELFYNILTNLQEIYNDNVNILNENKLISIKINNITFKIDIIQCREPKKS